MSDHRPQEIAAALLRTSMGVLLIAHGALFKYATYGFAGTAMYFASIGLPAFVGYLVIIGETIGGFLMVIGYRVRLVAALFLPLMVGATIVHVPNGWVFSAPGGGFEFPAFWTVALIAQILLGPGSWSFDHIVDVSEKSRRLEP